MRPLPARGSVLPFIGGEPYDQFRSKSVEGSRHRNPGRGSLGHTTVDVLYAVETDGDSHQHPEGTLLNPIMH